MQKDDMPQRQSALLRRSVPAVIKENPLVRRLRHLRRVRDACASVCYWLKQICLARVRRKEDARQSVLGRIGDGVERKGVKCGVCGWLATIREELGLIRAAPSGAKNYLRKYINLTSTSLLHCNNAALRPRFVIILSWC
jgi:hypothetical protein